MGERVEVEFYAKIKPIKPINSEFTLCKCYVMALGKNRNISYFSKEAVEDAIPTIFNIPVIGHVYADKDGVLHMGGHDMTIQQDADGEYVFKSLCVPYGTVPQQDDIHYEDIKEPNGDIHTYLVADIILWTSRFPELNEAVYSENIYFGQSMEITPITSEPLEEDKNYANITKYAYSALCLLGKSEDPESHVEPCFPMSRVEPYSFSLDEGFSKLMEQFKSELALCFESNSSKEGGNNSMTKEMQESILSEFSLTIEQINFEITTEMTEDVLKQKCKEFSDQHSEQNNGQAEEPQISFSATYEQKRNALCDAVSAKCDVEKDSDGKVIKETYFWVNDFDDSYVYVEKCIWDSDNRYDRENGRFLYSFNSEATEATISGDFELMVLKWLTVEENSQIEKIRSEYAELVDFKNNYLKAEHKTKVDEVIDQFKEELSDIKEFTDLTEKAYSYDDLKLLEEKCFAIRGKYNTAKPKKTQGLPKAPLDQSSHSDIFTEFFSRYKKNK